jgi:hypothetical protein
METIRRLRALAETTSIPRPTMFAQRPGGLMVMRGREDRPVGLIERGVFGMDEKKGKAGGEAEVLATIAAMPDADRAMAERLHEIIRVNAPVLSP